MLTIDGTIVSGLGAASSTIAAQMPHLEKQWPHLKGWHPGTINVALDAQLEVTSLDFVSDPIKWHRSAPAEMFGFKRIVLEHSGTQYNGLLYIPFSSPHRLNPYYAEVMLPRRENLVGNACKLHFAKGQAKVLA